TSRNGNARLLKRKGLGKGVEDAGGHAHVAGHGSIDTIAKALAGGVELVEAPPRQGIVAANQRARFRDDPVAFLPAHDLFTKRPHPSGELVAEHYGIAHGPGMVRGPLMKVAATDPHVGDLEEDVLGADGGALHLPQFDAVPLWSVVDDSGGSHASMV